MRRAVILPLVLAGSFAFGMDAYEALAPEYQQQREVESIISSEEFIQWQQEYGDPAARINRNEEGYLIETDYYHVQVRIVFEDGKHIGPAQYHLEFDEPIAKQ